MKFNLPPALRYLDNLQKKQNLVSLRKFEEDEIYRMSLDKSYESPVHFLIEPDYVEIRNRIPELQSIIQFQILERHKKDFDNLILNKFENSKNYHVSDKVYFGTVITSEINARIIPIDNGYQYLVILNESLWDSLKAVSDIVAEPLLLNKSALFEINWKAAEQNVNKFGEIIQRIIMCQNLYGVELKTNTEKSDIWNFFWGEFHESMESFVFGHEYGHFLMSQTFNNDIPTIKKWAQEYEADRVGFDLSVMQGIQRLSQLAMFTLCGIYLFFAFMIILEWYSGHLTTLESHPPTIFRYAGFKSVCLEQMGNKGLETFDKFISTLRSLLDYYESNARPIILNNIPKIDIKRKIERIFQYSAFWCIMEYHHREMIEYLEKLYTKISNNSNMIRIGDQLPFPVESILENRQLPLSLEGLEKLLNSSIYNNFLSRDEVLKIIETTKNIYETNRNLIK